MCESLGCYLGLCMRTLMKRRGPKRPAKVVGFWRQSSHPPKQLPSEQDYKNCFYDVQRMQRVMVARATNR